MGSIFVTLDPPAKLSTLGVDKTKYERAPFPALHPSSTYSDFTEGFVYTVRETDDTVMNIEYLPSTKDCEEVIRSQAHAQASNDWRGLVPLRSTRAEVEQLLGVPDSSIGDIYTYRTPTERVDVSYSENPCKVGATSRGMPNDVVLKIMIAPQRVLLVSDLRLDSSKYKRIQSDHPENWVQYLNSEEGIRVDAMVNEGCEEVIGIIYQATTRDRELRCGRG